MPLIEANYDKRGLNLIQIIKAPKSIFIIMYEYFLALKMLPKLDICNWSHLLWHTWGMLDFHNYIGFSGFVPCFRNYFMVVSQI